MKRAQKNNAVLNEKFFFRRSIFTSNTPACCTQMCAKSNEAKTMTNGPSSNSGGFFVFYAKTLFKAEVS